MLGSRGQGRGGAGQAGHRPETCSLGPEIAARPSILRSQELRRLSDQRLRDREGVSIKQMQRGSEPRSGTLEVTLWMLKNLLTGDRPEKKVKMDFPFLVSPARSPSSTPDN